MVRCSRSLCRYPYLQQVLQALDVLDGVAQDLDLGQPLVGIGRCASLEDLKGLVNLKCGKKRIIN